jgi:hypothetical protein
VTGGAGLGRSVVFGELAKRRGRGGGVLIALRSYCRVNHARYLCSGLECKFWEVQNANCVSVIAPSSFVVVEFAKEDSAKRPHPFEPSNKSKETYRPPSRGDEEATLRSSNCPSSRSPSRLLTSLPNLFSLGRILVAELRGSLEALCMPRLSERLRLRLECDREGRAKGRTNRLDGVKRNALFLRSISCEERLLSIRSLLK